MLMITPLRDINTSVTKIALNDAKEPSGIYIYIYRLLTKFRAPTYFVFFEFTRWERGGGGIELLSDLRQTVKRTVRMPAQRSIVSLT